MNDPVWKSFRGAVCVALLLASGCASEPDPLEAPGIEWSADKVFRYHDFAGQDVKQMFDVARRVLRFRFAGGAISEDEEHGRLQTRPRGFARIDRRVTLFVQISAIEGGARVEVFAPVDELLDDPRDDPEDPWRTIGRDARLENFILEDMYANLETKPAAAARQP